MKKPTNLSLALCLLILGIAESCKSKFDEKKYLTELLNNIEKVKSASYVITITLPVMGDETRFNTFKYYAKEFANPMDTAIGSSHGLFYLEDNAKLHSAYDGNAKIDAYHDDKRIAIDSFKVYSVPFRRTRSFFTSTKDVVKYALNSNDSTLTEFYDFGDSLLFSLTIYSDKQVVLGYGKPAYFEMPYEPDEVISKYDIWINNSTKLPYKYKITYPGSSSCEEINELQVNTMNINDFIPARYIPADYDIVFRGEEQKPATADLTGTKVPDWTLSDYNNESFALKDFASKVLLLQFSGIGCPPCHASLPFLNQLVTNYKGKSFELVRIECWSNNVEAIKNYRLNNNIEYKFLISDKEIEKKYNVLAVPTFFILDDNRTIQKVIRGFPAETTAKEIREKEIREAINKLL